MSRPKKIQILNLTYTIRWVDSAIEVGSDAQGWCDFRNQLIVINKDNYEKVFKKLQEGKKDIVLFGLTDDGYEQLAINFAQVRKYIMLNRNVLMQYKKYYEGNDDGSEETRTRK